VTLFVTQPGFRVAHRQGRLIVEARDGSPSSVPRSFVDSVVLFGDARLTAAARTYFLDNAIPVTFLSRLGKYQGCLIGDRNLRSGLLKTQFDWVEGTARLPSSQNLVAARLRQSRLTLASRIRTLKNPNPIRRSIQGLKRLEKKARRSRSLSTLRGVEGAGARSYFSAWASLTAGKPLEFTRRSRRPPEDGANALLGFSLHLLRLQVEGALCAAHLDPATGFYHNLAPGHDALSSDLMEPFRAWTERFVLGLIRTSAFSSEDFESGSGCYLTGPARLRVIREHEAYLRQQPASLGRLGVPDRRAAIFAEARHLAQTIRARAIYSPKWMRAR
jgi:CRISPR-associated protein Cas1